MALEADLTRAFAPLRGTVLAGYLWGSRARGEATARSDIDVCLLAGPRADVVEILRAGWRCAAGFPAGRVDVQVFEELPAPLQGAVLEEGILLFADDLRALGDYLRPFQKRWRDQRHRVKLTRDEAARLLDRLGRGAA